MLLRSYQGKTPRLGKPRFIAPNATIVGDVTLGDGSSVWYGAVDPLRPEPHPHRAGLQRAGQRHHSQQPQ